MTRIRTPHGVNDFLPGDAKRHQALLQKVRSVFEKRGYKKIKTPTIEYLETLSVGMGDTLQNSAIKFFDAAGHVLVLRPDHTTPIARMVATRLQSEKKPLRLYYLDPVFRQGEEIEIFQAGVELIGEDSARANAEVVMTAIESLLKLGYREFKIDIGHTDFVKGLSEKKKQALLSGNYLEFGKIPERGSVHLVKDHSDLVELFDSLKKNKLESYVDFNKGLVKDLDYYTGMIMECFVCGVRQPVGSGGQYNQLLKKFGFDCPAVGFALNLNVLLGSR